MIIMLDYELFKLGETTITSGNIIFSLLIIIAAPISFLLFRKFFLLKYYRRKNIEIGRSYAISTLLKYVFYIVFFLIALQASGIKLSLLLAAGAALLVGVGIGLQQTFNDFASGLILLIEGSVQKGDWVEVGDTEGKVIKIGLRTSLIETRRKVTIIVPNSKITVDEVVNLSHQDNKILRYTVSVGVAYGSDVIKVKNILLKCARNHKKVLSKPEPAVRFTDFGDSSLDFELLFWSDDYDTIEFVKSDIRFLIDAMFREHKIEIPFPQRDLHIKSSSVNFNENKLN